MANDVHYIIIFVGFFLVLGLFAPLINEEFGSSLTEEDIDSLEGDKDNTSGLDMILNIFALPFWTFGFPNWVNLWIFAPLRIVFLFVIGRNIWVGGGG